MILVTGGSGFLGRHLVRRLSAQGLPLRALYNNNKPSDELTALPGVEWQQCDLLDIFDVEDAMRGISDVYHCAAIVSYQPELRDKMLHANPEATANLVNEAIARGIRKFVYASSIATIGRPADNTTEATEENEWGENEYASAYAMSKYLAENEVWRGIGEGICAAIVNPSVILGHGDWSTGSAQLMSVAYKEFPFYTNGINGWVDVEDVVSAMMLLMDSDIESERFIISQGNYPYRDIFTRMASALGKRPPRYYAGPLLTSLVWRFNSLVSRLTGKKQAITKESAKTAHSISRYSNAHLLHRFPEFKYTPIDDTITRMAAAFLQDRNK